MLRLKKIIMVQFYLYEAIELDLTGNAVVLGPNGSGKTSLLDAIQIAYMGAHGGFLAFNAQSTGARNKRNVREYCLGLIRHGEEANAPTDRKRDHATTYVSLVYGDDTAHRTFSVGVSLSASAAERDHKTNGLYVLPGVELSLADHLEVSGEDQLPLAWTDFSQRIKRLCLGAGMTPSIQTSPEHYIREFLHQQQPSARHIDSREFLKAFKNSMRLRDIESVDDFVRKHIIDEQRIDRNKAKDQIEEFRKLRQLVEQVERQITELEGLNVKFRKVGSEYRRAATLKALAAIYETEQASDNVSELEETLQGYRETLEQAEADFGCASAAYRAKDQEFLEATRLQDPSVGEMETLEQMKGQNTHAAQAYRTQLLTFTDRLVRTLRLIDKESTLNPGSRTPKDALTALERVHVQLNDGAFDRAGAALTSAVTAIESLRASLELALDAARETQRQAQQQFAAARAAHERLKTGGANVAQDTARLIEQLGDAGIQATPVCELVRVTNPAWQPAIEAYLSSNRESLLIQAGRERDAVRFVRQLPLAQRPYGVTIIQPTHLRADWSDCDRVLVGSLLESKNEIALAYLRSLFGTMRMAESEEELEKHPRALTIDGMLSARGGTRAIRLLGAHQLLLGVQASREQQKQAGENMQQAAAALAQAGSAYTALNDIAHEVIGVREAARMLPQNLDLGAQAHLAAMSAEQKLARFDRTKIDALRERRESIGKERTELDRERERLNTEVTRLTTLIGTTSNALNGAHERTRRLAEAEKKACEAEDFDAETLDAQRQRIDDLKLSAEMQIQRARSDAENASKRAIDQTQLAMPEFVRYLDTHGVALLEERSDWRSAHSWVIEESTRLKQSELINYREQAEHARDAAETAFRKDIAIRLRESIQRMKVNLKALDQTLACCPPFSNGERYRFEAKAAENYKAIYQFIMNAAEEDGAQGGLFKVQDAVQDRILELLEQQASADPSRAPNPLDDYRLLFTFDLLIEKDGQVISRLSKRIGTGSNGEHRTPFYVVAGAALAAAYRIAPGKKPEGASLMLLDEAFHGMDHQNATAVGDFLSALGLQLIMAAPETDYGKFAGLCDTVYDIARDNLHVFIEPSQMKEEGQKLMQSDLPSKHPELLTQKLAATGTSSGS